MKFFKIPLSADLSITSYRCWGQIGEFAYIEYNDGFEDPSWEEIDEEDIQLLFPEWFVVNEDIEEEIPQLTQLDRLEALVSYLILQNSDDI